MGENLRSHSLPREQSQNRRHQAIHLLPIVILLAQETIEEGAMDQRGKQMKPSLFLQGNINLFSSD